MPSEIPTLFLCGAGYWLAGSRGVQRLTEYETIAAFAGIVAITVLLTILGV